MNSLEVQMTSWSNPFMSLSSSTLGPADSGQSAQCHKVHGVNESYECDFVMHTSDCDIDDGIINYTRFIYCTLHSSLVPLAIFILVIWLVFLFIAMAVCADEFFCPPLVVMAKILNMSDNVAGVTLLAFGNGAADVFSAIAAINSSKNGDVGLAMGALLGAGIFITTLIPGAISFVNECRVSERPILRDIIFFIIAVYLIFVVLFSRKISLMMSIVFFCVYVVYVFVVVFGRFVFQRQRQPDTAIPAHSTDEEDEVPITEAIPSTPDDERENSVDSEFTPLLGGPHIPRVNGWKEFVVSITPINPQTFRGSQWYLKLYMIVKAPSLFILQICIPLMDYSRPKNGWSRYLNVMQCVIAPLMAILVAKPYIFVHYLGGHFPVWALVLILGSVAAVIVYLTSNHHAPPIYHPLFAVFGFAAAVVWTEFLATEIVNILTTFGIVFNISDAILGLTLLAWGNSLGDLVADLAIARKGFPRTAIAACYGGPLFNLLLGIGIPFTIRTISEGTQKLQFTLIQVLLVTSLFFHLIVTLFVLLITRFTVKRAFGIYCCIFYVIFVVLAVLIEQQVITSKFLQ